MSLHKVFVYGTLRPTEVPTHTLYDYAMYDCGKFPYIVPNDHYIVVGEVITVTDAQLKQLDKYENVQSGLFVRETATVYPIDGSDGEIVFVYVAGNIVPPIINSGDWFSK